MHVCERFELSRSVWGICSEEVSLQFSAFDPSASYWSMNPENTSREAHRQVGDRFICSLFPDRHFSSVWHGLIFNLEHFHPVRNCFLTARWWSNSIIPITFYLFFWNDKCQPRKNYKHNKINRLSSSKKYCSCMKARKFFHLSLSEKKRNKYMYIWWLQMHSDFPWTKG